MIFQEMLTILHPDRLPNVNSSAVWHLDFEPCFFLNNRKIFEKDKKYNQDDMCEVSSSKELKWKAEKKVVEVQRSRHDNKQGWHDKVPYLGHPTSLGWILPNERLTKKIAEMITPGNKKELESFLELNHFILPRRHELAGIKYFPKTW